MTKLLNYNADDHVITAEIFLCRSYARELYGEDLEGPSDKYDKEGLEIYTTYEGSLLFPEETDADGNILSWQSVDDGTAFEHTPTA